MGTRCRIATSLGCIREVMVKVYSERSYARCVQRGRPGQMAQFLADTPLRQTGPMPLDEHKAIGGPVAVR